MRGQAAQVAHERLRRLGMSSFVFNLWQTIIISNVQSFALKAAGC